MAKPAHIPQAAYDAAIAKLETAPALWKQCAKSCSGNICAGGYIDTEGKDGTGQYGRVGAWGGTVCHGFMESNIAKNVLFFNTMVEKHMDSDKVEANRAFMTWLKNKSPVRRYILNDTVDSMMTGGVIIDCVKSPTAVRLWICKMCRLCYEDRYRVPVWYNLVKEGVHPTLALCVSQLVSAKHVLTAGTHNTCMGAPKTKADVERLFIDHVEDEDAKKNPYGNWDTSSVFGGKRGYYSGEECAGLLPIGKVKMKTVKVPDGWGGYIERQEEEKVKGGTLADRLKEFQREYI